MIETNLEWIKRLERERGRLIAELREIMRQEQERYDRSYRAAVSHNNTEGVGVHFDYATYPALPKWFAEASALIEEIEKGEKINDGTNS
jgi:hypothetical protein